MRADGVARLAPARLQLAAGVPALARAAASAERLGSGGRRRFFRLTGSGDVWIAGAPARWMPLALMEDVLYVREDRVLAFEGRCRGRHGHGPRR